MPALPVRRTTGLPTAWKRQLPLVVTVIEFLSHTNKLSGAGQESYRKKQSEILASNASLVEIDYEPLPAASDCFDAIKDGAPLAHEGSSSNVAARIPFSKYSKWTSDLSRGRFVK